MKKIIIILICIITISCMADAQTISEWLNSDAGIEFAVAGITTYYLTESPAIQPDLIKLNTGVSPTTPAFTITSRVKLNDVNVGEGAIRIVEDGRLKCIFSIKNNTDAQRNITVVIATYTQQKTLFKLVSASITLESYQEQDYELIYDFNAEFEAEGKIMFWDSLSGMVPLRTSIDFSQKNGVNAYYYDLDNHLLQVDKANGTSLLYTYDKTGNFLRKSVRK